MQVLREISIAAPLLGAPAAACAQPMVGPVTPVTRDIFSPPTLGIELGAGGVITLPASAVNAFGVAARRTTVAAPDNEGQTHVRQYRHELHSPCVHTGTSGDSAGFGACAGTGGCV
jgi:hypothetical protein